MKKIYLSLSLLFSSVIAVGQSIHILYNNKDVTNTTVTIPVAKGDQALADFALLNTTSNMLKYKISRTILNPPFDECGSLYFCTALQCYAASSAIDWTGPYIDSIRANEKLPSDSGTTGLAAHYDVCTTTCFDLKVLYKVYLSDPNLKDTAFITVLYSCATGIAEEDVFGGTLSDAYPNPSDAGFLVNYSVRASGKAALLLYDLYGKKIREILLQGTDGSSFINTASLTDGVYFYSLIVNGRRATTRQLVVNHKTE